MMKILVTGLVPRAGLDALFDNFDVTYSTGNPFPREEISSLLLEMNDVLLMKGKAHRNVIN